MDDRRAMGLALALARKGAGYVNPNPMVGALIVKDGAVIGRGWHERYGAPHAERNALANCGASPENATLYVTLEPCAHHGKTPPCTEAVIESGVSRVVVGVKDPNPLVAGKGIESLRRRGIEVEVGCMEAECAKLNEVFFHYIRTNTPYVVMKYAMTMDGKIASRTGASKWITGEAARERTHRDRHRYAAVMAGVGTVLTDDPLLTCRLANGRNPVRIICDTNLRTPLDSKLVETAGDVPTIIATACANEEKRRPYLARACDIITVSKEGGHVCLPSLMAELGRRGLDSVLLEGGGELNWSALQAGVVNRVQAYVAPKLMGGAGAKTPVMGLGAEAPGSAFRLANCGITVLGEDILIESDVIRNEAIESGAVQDVHGDN